MKRSIDSENSPNRRTKARILAPAAVMLAGSLALAGCAEAAPEKLEVSTVSSRGVELPQEIAEFRTRVLEICNTGSDAKEMRERWEKSGYAEMTDKSWNEAFEFVTDFGGYSSNPESTIYFGEFAYPTVISLAENCEEAAFLLSSGIHIANGPTHALPAIEAYRENPDTNLVLTQVYDNIKSGEMLSAQG